MASSAAQAARNGKTSGGKLDHAAYHVAVLIRIESCGFPCRADRDDDVKAQHARCSMVKLFVSEMANRVADRAVQIFGGRGYMRENVAERFFRELRVDRIWEGTSEIQRLIIARSLLKRGLDGI